MAFTKKEQVKKFKVGNVEIVIGDKYVLDNKFDASAPMAMQEVGTTKYPFTGSGVYDCVHFDQNKTVYDTGFYETSYCLSQYTEEERPELVKIYNSQIREPFEKFRNVDLNQKEDSLFWEKYRYEAYANKEFDTTDPVDLMELFQIIIQGIACNKDEKIGFYKDNAQFIISNPSAVKNKAKEKSKIRLEAIRTLSTLANADKDKLDLVLEFIGRNDTHKVSAEDLELIYFEVFNDKKSGLDAAETFIQVCREYETPEGKEKMESFYAVNKLFKFRKIVKDRRGYTTLDGTWLGNTLQDIAKWCLNKSSVQYKAIEQLMEENPAVRREVK